jgi:hypothetical protein
MTLDEIKGRTATHKNDLDRISDDLRLILSERIEGVSLIKARTVADGIEGALEYIEDTINRLTRMIGDPEPDSEDEEEVA